MNAQDAKGNTALHLAAATGRQQVVDLLLNASADPDMNNENGKTALDNSIRSHSAVSEALKRAGGDLARAPVSKRGKRSQAGRER